MYVVKGLEEKTLGDTDRAYNEFLQRKKSKTDSPTPKSHSKHIIVLGAGIAGLQTAISLRTAKELHHIGVHIISELLPDNPSVDYASHQAGGHWRSYATTALEDERIRGFEKRTYDYWNTMWPSRKIQSRGNEGLIPRE